jgi:hypothetical protein
VSGVHRDGLEQLVVQVRDDAIEVTVAVDHSSSSSS